jgi:hypothetical protein
MLNLLEQGVHLQKAIPTVLIGQCGSVVLDGVLAILSFSLLFYLAETSNGDGFKKALIFAGILLGGITGYYFGTPKRHIHKPSDDDESWSGHPKPLP